VADTFTTYLGLTKPDFDGGADIREINTDLDLIDAALGGVHNVIRYGATGLGLADDGPAFNAALVAALAAGGGVVYAPAGTYKITTQITFPGSGLSLVGDGIGRTILTDGALLTNAIVFASGRSNVTVREMTIQPQAATGSYGFYIQGGATQITDVLVENVLVDQRAAGASGCVVTGGAGGMNRVTIRGLVVKSVAAGTGVFGFSLGAGNNGTVSYNALMDRCTFDGFNDAFRNGTPGVWEQVKITNCTFTNARQHGAVFYHMGQTLISGCEFTINDVGMWLDEGAGNQGSQVTGCHFTDNVTLGAWLSEMADDNWTACNFVGNAYGLWISAGQHSTYTGCSFNGNSVHGVLVDRYATIVSLRNGAVSYDMSAPTAVSNYIENVVMAGCTIAHNGHHGIAVKGAQRSFALVGCVIAANGQADAPTPANYYDVWLTSDAAAGNNYGVRIEACTIGNLGGVGAFTGYALYGVRSESGTLSYLTIANCRFEAVGTAIYVPTAVAASVKGCTFLGVTTVTVPAAPTTDWRANTIVGGSLGVIAETLRGAVQGAMGTAVAAANNLVLGVGGNVFSITGNTQINLLSDAAWQAGSVVTLLFSGTPTVKHNQAVSGANKPILLAGAVDFVASANDTLTLVSNGTSWFEVARAVI